MDVRQVEILIDMTGPLTVVRRFVDKHIGIFIERACRFVLFERLAEIVR